MPLKPIPFTSKSGNIVDVEYNEDNQTMRVTFNGGKKYEYVGVDPEIASTASDAPSFGEYLHKVVKPVCPCSKVDEEEES